MKERYEELGEEEIGRTVALMVAKYHEKKEESLLHLIWNLLNFINMDKRSKVVQFNTKGVLILNKIDIDKLNIPENLAALIKKSVIHIRKQVKVDKQ